MKKVKKAYFPYNLILWIFKKTIIWGEIKKAQGSDFCDASISRPSRKEVEMRSWTETSAERKQPNRFIRWLRLFFINTDVYKNKNIRVAMIDPLFLQILTIGKPYELSESHYNHEACHIEQVKRDGRLKFIVKYLFYNIKYGYKNNPYEVEARKYE